MSGIQLPEPFDTDAEEGGGQFSPIPPGTYKAEIIDGSAGPTKNGRGYAASLRWQITEGEHERRQVFQQVMLQHESEAAQKIGRQMFKDITVACGVGGVVESLEPLFYKTCAITLKIEVDKSGEYPDKNRVTRVFPVTAMASPQQAWRAQASAALREASKVQPGFKKVEEPFNDDIPF